MPVQSSAYSIASAIRNDLDVWSYLKGLLDALLAGEQDYNQLMPHRWAESHPEQIREYRCEDRDTRAEKKLTRNAQRQAVRKRAVLAKSRK